MTLHATTIRFADRAYTAIAQAADEQGISVSQHVGEAALIRAVLHELDAPEALHTAHDLLAVAREVRRLAEVEPAGPPRAVDVRGTLGPRRQAGASPAGRTAQTPSSSASCGRVQACARDEDQACRLTAALPRNSSAQASPQQR